MLTSIVKTSNKFLNNHHGFSLIEIMVALLLAAIIFVAVPTGDTSAKHRALQNTIDDFDRSVRFASNESVLRNRLVRLRIDLDQDPIQYVVEYGPSDNLVLPDQTEEPSTGLSLEEEKAAQDAKKKLDGQFTKVEEFEDIRREINQDVSFIGLASTIQKKIMSEGQAVIYFYPTGERDGALFFLGTNEEMAWLEVEPFQIETRQTFYTFPTESVAKTSDLQQTKMDEIVKEWQKN